MKITRLIEQLQSLQKEMPEADVRLNSPFGDTALFALAFEKTHNADGALDNIIWIEGKNDIEIGVELEARFKNASEKQMDELDFFTDLLDTGFTLEDIEEYLPEKYEYSKQFMIKHGLV